MNNKQSNFIKYPYSALALNNADYDSFLKFRNWCSTTKKSGFIRKGELQSVAVKTNVNINKLYRLRSKFKQLGWVVKYEDGDRLLSISTINNYLNLKTKEHKIEGFVFNPFFKISKENIEHLEEIKMHSLILQTAKRYTYHLPKANKIKCSTPAKGKENANDKGFAVSLLKLKEKGNYEYNSQVDNIITKAEILGLITRNKNGFNENTRKYNCNDYVLSNYEWYAPLTKSTVENKPVEVEKKETKKTVWNSSELKFKNFVNEYLVELINAKYLDSKYYSKTLSKSSYSKLLKKILIGRNAELRKIMLGYINLNDISITKKYLDLKFTPMNYFNSLPHEFNGKDEYAVDFRFSLKGNGNINQLTKAVENILSALFNYYQTDEKKTVYVDRYTPTICI